jgi:hypothetical protein
MAIRAYINSGTGSFDETPNETAGYQDPTIAAAEALTGAVTTQIAAAQAIGVGDASAEIDAADTAFVAVAAALSIIGLANQVTTDLAAAQAIGIGDASAEVDALDASFVAFEAGLANLVAGSSGAGNLTILLNNTTLTTKTQIRDLLNAFLEQLENSDTFAE